MKKDSSIDIIATAQLIELQKAKRVAELQNWAFGKGGSYNIITLTDGSMLGAVDNPSGLSKPQCDEISAAIKQISERREAVNPGRFSRAREVGEEAARETKDAADAR